MNTLELDQLDINKIENRTWQLVLLSVVVILYLTLSLIGIQFSGIIENSQSVIHSAHTNKYSTFLATLVLLFCGYMIVYQRRLIQISKAFAREREASQTLSRNVKTLRSLLQVGSIINSQQKPADILKTITEEIVSCFDATHSSIMLLDKQSKIIKTRVSVGQGSEIVDEAVIPMGESVAGFVVKTGSPLLLNGKVAPGDFPGVPKKHRRITSSMCVPLKMGKKSIGVLNVNLVDSDSVFSDADLNLLVIFANNVAVAIRNAKLYAEIKSLNLNLEEKVKDRTRKLETANRARSDFWAGMSHELRTPLNAIIGFSQVLMDQHFGKLGDKQKDYTRDILESGNKLLSMIDDIFEIIKIQENKIKPCFERVGIKSLLESGLSLMQNQLDLIRFKLELQIPAALESLEISADEQKLRQLMFNLLSNAAKFTPDGGEIRVSADLLQEAVPRGKGTGHTVEFPDDDSRRHQDWVEISVQDTGIGIPPESLEKIFEEFYQVKSGMVDKSPGTGLGLSLARCLAEVHNGFLWAESEGEGKGSRFALAMPINQDREVRLEKSNPGSG